MIRSVNQSARPSRAPTSAATGRQGARRPARRWSAAAGPFVRRSARPSSTSTSARGRIDLLIERAGEIADCGLGQALGQQALGRLAKRGDHERVGSWGDAEQVPAAARRRAA